MKLVAGLGNPGAKYRGTRHNVGFDVLDLVAARHGLVFESAPADAMLARWRIGADVVLLVKPLGFMNTSGGPIAAVSQYYRVALADVVVVCDDVNLPIGRLRARATGSEGGHNGLRSIADTFGTVDYARIRVGIGRGDTRRDMADYVLARFDDEERPEVDAAIARTADAVETWAREGLAVVMNTFNRADVGRAEGKPGHDTKTNGHD